MPALPAKDEGSAPSSPTASEKPRACRLQNYGEGWAQTKTEINHWRFVFNTKSRAFLENRNAVVGFDCFLGMVGEAAVFLKACSKPSPCVWHALKAGGDPSAQGGGGSEGRPSNATEDSQKAHCKKLDPPVLPTAMAGLYN
jgi:hypothetical protein